MSQSSLSKHAIVEPGYFIAQRSILWDIYFQRRNAQLHQQCTPIPISSKPTVSTKDVSILIPTIDTPDSFSECMQLWLANRPLEVIIVTVPRDLARVKELLSRVKQEGKDAVPITVLTVPKPGRRAQMDVALQKASGRVVAFVDDDTYWPTDKVLPYLLAGFDDPAVGGIVGTQSAFIPPNRRNPATITASEVATMRALAVSSAANARAHASSGTVLVLTGRTMLARAEPLQSLAFRAALTSETAQIGGKPANGKTPNGTKSKFSPVLINTGDDGFLTSYLRNSGWKLVCQSAPEAEVLTLAEPGPIFLKQLVRWRRSGMRTFLRLCVEEGGFLRLWREYPAFSITILQFVTKPFVTMLDMVMWALALWEWPTFCMMIATYYIYQCVAGCLAFKAEHPWLGYRHLWAVAVMDHIYTYINIYVIWTLGAEGWLTRDDSSK